MAEIIPAQNVIIDADPATPGAIEVKAVAFARASSSNLRIRSRWEAFAALFSALVMPLSKRGAGESQIINPLDHRTT